MTTELRYRDKVKINHGFYLGLEGYIVSCEDVKDHYYVEMTCFKNNILYEPSAWIHKDYLEKINEQ